MFENHQLLDHLFLIGVQEPCELARSQRSVQLQETPKGRDGELGPHVCCEVSQMSLSGVDVRFLEVRNQRIRVLVRRWVWRNELGASVREQFLESRDALLASRHLSDLLAESLLDDVQDVIVQPTGRQRVANGEQGVHPVCSFVDLVVLVAPCVVLPHAEDEVQDRHERARRIRVSPEHHVAEPDVVVG